jgi:cytochrome oxidase Cu insertion factor (SCO1/SenC/PrrC family)
VPFKNAVSSALQLAFVIAAAILVYSFVATAREGETRRKCSAMCLMQPSYAGAERTLPRFELQDLDGRVHQSSEWDGKVIVVNFWNTTCRFCLQEMPSLVELAKVLHSRTDVAVVTISTDEDASLARDALKSLTKGSVPFEALIDPESKVVGGKFGTTLYPETWIVDAHGIIRARFDGGRDWSSSAVVELVDEVRAGTYCPISIRKGTLSSNADAVKLCETVSGAGSE